MIFNKDNKGSEELKSLIGFINADITFENFRTYIDFAERDLKKIIGKEIFNVAYDHYMSDNYLLDVDPQDSGSGSGATDTNAIKDMLVRHIQLPIAFHADLTYEQSNDLNHSDKGRRMMVSEEEKLPFQWLIKQDNDNILSLAHKSTDILLEFLMDHKQYFPEWTGSDAYKKSLSLFVNTAEQFDAIFSIDCSRRLFMIMNSFIREVETKYIRPVIGKESFEELKAKILENSLDDDDKELLEMINVPLVLYTMSIAVRRLSVTILPAGIFENYESETNSLNAKKPAGKDVKMNFSISLETDAKEKLKDLQQFVSIKDDAEYTPPAITERHKDSNLFFRP